MKFSWGPKTKRQNGTFPGKTWEGEIWLWRSLLVLDDGGLAGLGGHIHAALEAAAGWHLQRTLLGGASLLGRREETLGGDLLNTLPAEQTQRAQKRVTSHPEPSSVSKSAQGKVQTRTRRAVVWLHLPGVA